MMKWFGVSTSGSSGSVDTLVSGRPFKRANSACSNLPFVFSTPSESIKGFTLRRIVTVYLFSTSDGGDVVWETLFIGDDNALS